ncbi:topology modulation protein [Mycoplasmatota bacterium]|nr:topology modulation protein [Mycoplasmatota bacterium]
MMQKIWITGSSGAGKTTLANKLGSKLNIPVYHRDKITWKENWITRSEKEQIELVMGISNKDKWIFEGNRFTASRVDGRLDNCDTLIYLDMNRFICFYRCLKRYLTHRNNPRCELPKGCKEEFTMEVAKYILFEYPRKKSQLKQFLKETTSFGKKVIILKGKREVKKWYKKC